MDCSFDNYTYFERAERQKERQLREMECDEEFDDEDDWDDEEFYD